MATSGELAEVLSRNLGIRLGKVNQYGQVLRNAGLLSKSGRGPAAARMMQEDARNWLVAMCCASSAKQVPGIVKATLAAPLNTFDRSGPIEVEKDLHFLQATSVADLIDRLFEDTRRHGLDPVMPELDFRIGVPEVRLAASALGNGRPNWRVWMRFQHNARNECEDDFIRSAAAIRITRVFKRVFEEIDGTLRNGNDDRAA